MIEGDIRAVGVASSAKAPDTTTTADGFQASLERRVGDTGMGAATRAAAMNGSLGTGPGCGCSNLVASAYRSTSDGATIAEAATPVVLQPAAVRPGDIILQSGGEHMGIAVSAARYVTVSTQGMVEETWIPWSEVSGIRRPS
jgi:cell wall-associated NlpC family hydrolase